MPFTWPTPAKIGPTSATLTSDCWTEVDADDETVGPFEVGQEDVTAVTTMHFIPVPYAYMHLVHDRVLTPLTPGG